MSRKIILDVPLEDLKDILSDKGWDVVTVTKELGSTPEARADKNILNYALQNKEIIVVTVDKPFVSRLRSAGVKVAALTLEDKSKIINEKLRLLDSEFD
jgi:rRNA-processing protein FCF1